ncbi:hypothetical protein [Fluoribacter gormanii]|uniref:hypothetical protein n=1 Tax=Fluoribacter gormanii TaxID=464 RepID=UPI001040F075|nr:hypothetical protein [Fluoribacter gormanii]
MSQDAYADTKPQYKPTDLKEEFLRIAQESEGYNLHLKSELPKDLNEYTGSYIYCNDVNNNKKLYYIDSNGESKEVPIKDFHQFEKNLNDINKQQHASLHLNDEQAKTLIANRDYTPPGLMEIKDFHISKRIREKIFKEDGRYSPEAEAKILKKLIDKSFDAVVNPKDTELSEAQHQAVWFHFVKYELPNYIIESLKPNSINFSCKDAIDRGGVASAYYNLIKSFQPLTEKEVRAGIEKIPMSREEFEQALHAAPTMVKGRGINHHINLIWNSVDAYVNANYKQLKDDPQKAWLIEWRDFNCPHQRVENLLAQRIQECETELDEQIKKQEQAAGEQQEASPKLEVLKQGINVLEEIKKQQGQKVSGKRLLFETTLRTTSMAISPETQTEKSLHQYEKLKNKLAIEFPELKILKGLIKIFAGTVADLVSATLSVVSAGKIDIKSDLTSRGRATFNAGWELFSRKSLQDNMKKQLTAMKSNNSNKEIANGASENDAPNEPSASDSMASIDLS